MSPSAYETGHIPEAMLWNAYTDLRDTDYRPIEPEQLERLLRGEPHNDGHVTCRRHDQAGSTRLLTGEKGETTGSYTYGAEHTHAAGGQLGPDGIGRWSADGRCLKISKKSKDL